MAEIPKPFPEEIREQFRSGIKETVAKNPNRLEDAVSARVTSGILGPLFEFDGLPTYSPEQIAFLNEYAHKAARLAVQRELDVLAINPLFQLDIALAVAGGKESTFARKNLRELQVDLKSKAAKIASTQEVGEMSTDDIARQILDKDNRFKRNMVNGREREITAVLVVLGDDELKKRVDDESEDLKRKSTRRTTFETPTVFSGISLDVNLNGEYGYLWFNLNLILDQETVKKVIEGPDLPPLPKE